MFDRSDRLALYINVLLAIFGIIFGLLSGFYLLGIIFSACALVLIYDLYRQNKTPFTITHLDKVLNIQDSSGKKAVETQKYTVTANSNGFTEFWFNNLSSNGTISHVHINGGPPAQRQQENDKVKVALKFDPPTEAGHEFDTTLSLTHQNAYTKNQGMLTHVIDNQTKLMRMVVELPAGRDVESVSLSRQYKNEDRLESPPTITKDKKIVADIANPPVGAEYKLLWNWPKDKLIDKLDSLFFHK